MMKDCITYQRLLHLHREGERSAKETEALERHLQTCPACAAEAGELLSAENLLARIRSSRPEVPADLADDILARIPIEEPVTFSKRVDVLLAGIGSFLIKPQFRIAALALIITTIGVFSYQYYGILRSVDLLETRFSLTMHAQAQAETTYLIPKEQMEAIIPADSLQAIYALSGEEQDDGTLRITRSTVSSLENLFKEELSAWTDGFLQYGISPTDVRQLTIRLEKICIVTITFDNNGV